MSRALIDTSVLTDCLLKETPQGQAARKAVAEYEVAYVPQYAVKEFKAGPLLYFIWLHNKVVTTQSWAEAIMAVSRVMAQKNRAATAIAAVSEFESSLMETLRKRGTRTIEVEEMDRLKRKEARVWLKMKILRAWKNRYKPPFAPFAPVTCYAEVDPYPKSNGIIEHAPVKCTLEQCQLAGVFRSEPSKTTRLKEVCVLFTAKKEMRERASVLSDLMRVRRDIGDKECRKLGDAVFALQCPDDAVILTTNEVDHRPLAASVGRSIRVPSA